MMEKDASRAATKILSNFASKLRYEDLPEDIRERAKVYIMDSLGCAIGGGLTGHGKTAVEMFSALGGIPESRVLATNQKIPCLHAVYVNSYLANALDFDDTYSSWAHPGASIIPPGYAVAEKVGEISGKAFIAAVVAGYEVSIRIGAAILPSQERYKQAWGISTHQIFGSVTVAGKLLSLEPEALAIAYGFAGNSAPVLHCRKIGLEVEERPFTWLKNNFGWSAMGGVLSAFLAQKGCRGPLTILDGDRGFWTMTGSDRCDFNLMVEDLRKKYLIAETSFKPYASCRWTHSTLDAVHEIMGQEVFSPEIIEKVCVNSFYETYRSLNSKHPENLVDAQFSIPFLVAVTLAGHSPSQGLYEEDLKDSTVYELAEKIRVESDEEADQLFESQKKMLSKVTIYLKDGREFRSRVDVIRGDPGKFQSLSEMQEKYKILVSRVLGEKTAVQSMELIMDLEKLSDVTNLF